MKNTKGTITDQLGYIKKDFVYLKKTKSKKIVYIKTGVTIILIRKKKMSKNFLKNLINNQKRLQNDVK